MNCTHWIQLERWYTSLNRIQQWLFKIVLVAVILLCVILVTHEPRERKQATKIILNCNTCGVDASRTATYNEYMDQKEQQQQVWFRETKQQIKQNIWDEHGRNRWCQNHPQDVNCK